jgi:hypothetical protein
MIIYTSNHICVLVSMASREPDTTGQTDYITNPLGLIREIGMIWIV